MSFEEEFDKIIRQKAEEAKFTFSDENWQKASRMIDAERNSAAILTGKKYLVYAIVGVMAIGATVVGALYFRPSTESGQQASTLQSSSSATITNPEQEIISKPSETTINNSTEIISADPVNEAVITKTETQGNLTSSQLKVEASKEPTPDQEVTNSQQHSPGLPSANNGPTNSGLVSNGTIPNIEATGLVSEATFANTDNKEESHQSNNNEEDQLQIESLNLHTASFAPLNTEVELTANNINFLARYDQDYYKKGAKTKTYFVDVEAGANYLMGWDVNGAQDAKGLNWFGGINVGYYLSKKFAFGVGAQLYTIQNILQPYYMNTEKVYGFGSTQSQTIITCNSLLYAALPIKLYYELTNQSVFALGFNTGFLLSANSSVEKYDLSDNAKFNTETKQIRGVYDGMKTVNAMLCASFMQQINGKLAIEVEANYGLSDLFMNTSVNNGNQTTSGFRVGINYRICSK